MRSIYSVVIIALLASMTSCERKELPVKPHDPGDADTATVDLGSPYRYQIFYNLRTNAAVSQNMKTAWDVAFETSPEGYHLVLNESKAMFAYSTGKTDFASVSYADTFGFGVNKKWDARSGNMDSTAVGDWRSNHPVYIIDKGYDENNKVLGLEKMQVLSVTDSNYTLRFAALNGAGDTTIQIIKDTVYNLAFASFVTNNEVTIEPPKATWDLEFSQYIFVFYEPYPFPYLVTGCLLNRYNTLAVKDSVDKFDKIVYGNISNYNLSNDISIIGYDWKTFDGKGYTVNPNDIYIIKTSDGRYYKMYFTGYYKGGAEGNPKWEYQQM